MSTRTSSAETSEGGLSSTAGGPRTPIDALRLYTGRPHIREAFGDLDINPPEPDGIIGLKTLFEADPNPDKISLAIGILYDEEGNVFIPEAVKSAARIVTRENRAINPEGYLIPWLPTEWNGDEDFMRETEKLVYGPFADSLIRDNVVASAATVGGTQPAAILSEAFKLRAEEGNIQVPRVLIGQPGYPNHKYIFEKHGLEVDSYNYTDPKTGKFDLGNTLQTIDNIDTPTLLVLQGNAHNPTGLGPRTLEEWQMIADATSRNQNVTVFIDFAYAGLDSASTMSDDFSPARLLSLSGTPTFVGVSYSKNAGLYDGRVGAVFSVCDDAKKANKMTRLLNSVIRFENSSPAGFGERVVATALTTPRLRRRWMEEELPKIALDTTKRREILANALPDEEAENVRDGIGIFTTLPITRAGVDYLRTEKHIYVVPIGDNMARICLGAATIEQMHRAAPALREALDKFHAA